MIRLRVTVLVATAVLATGIPAGGTPQAGHAVAVEDDEFIPRTARTRVWRSINDTVEWRWGDTIKRDHNVREDHAIFFSGPATDDPMEMFRRRFSAGSFHYYCVVHGSSQGGMAGTVKARLLRKDVSGPPFRIIWAATDTNTGGAYDVRFRVGGGPWRTWKTDISRFSGVFGQNGNPVEVQPNRMYRFQARSQKQPDTPVAVSGWSPRLTVTT
jgi:plastocyanin